MSKERVLRLLQDGGGYVSGESVSEALGITRAAVWKAVDALRRDGYEIESRKSRGYRLVAAPDRLGETEIRAAITSMREKLVYTSYVCAFGYAMCGPDTDVQQAIKLADERMKEDKAATKQLKDGTDR